MQLVHSDPSLLNGLDDDLLASITLRANRSLPPQTAFLTRECTESKAASSERQTIQLYPEDAPFVDTKTRSKLPISSNESNKASLPRSTTVLLSPSSTATALAASFQRKKELDTSAFEIGENTSKGSKRTFSPAMQRERPVPVTLFDASTLRTKDKTTKATDFRQDFGKKGAKKKRSNRMRLGKTRNKSENGSSTNSEDEGKAGKTDQTGWGTVSSIRYSASFESDSDDGVQAASTITSSATCDATMASRVLLDQHFVPRDRRLLLGTRKACYVCMREFNVLRKRHLCRMCGEVICRRCSVCRLVKTPLMEDKLRICTCCFVAYRKKQEEGSNQSDANGELSSYKLANDGNAGHCKSSIFTPAAALPVPLASNTGSLQASLSLSPSDNTSDRTSSTINTRSDFSFTSDTILDGNFSSSRHIEDELEAVLKAKQLEKEVEASQERIQALEAQIASQESQQDLLSLEQQVQLHEARATIKLLQEQLCKQEVNARQAAYNRDSICLSKLRQTEVYSNEDDESDALKKKLKVLERQLQQAGISVAEVIPYKVAKRRVIEISKRLQEIGSSEVVLADKQAQAAARKEYYILEQEMEKYHMALVMTDEYIEEQRRQEQEWEEANERANREALRLLRSAIPVDTVRLSERELIEIVTPTGKKFPPELARRLKRTNVLQLLRTDPRTIVKMHPSVIEGYRTSGLSLLERRALHAVMKGPFKEWTKQQKDGMAQRKYAWYCKLKEAYMTAATTFTKHYQDKVGDDESVIGAKHKCEIAGSACPVRTEERVQRLYSGLGFTTEAEYVTEVIVKSDPEGAGEKALLEAQGYAREYLIDGVRQRDVIAFKNVDKGNAASEGKRVSWVKRTDGTNQHLLSDDPTANHPAVPISASLFDAIKARRKQNESLVRNRGCLDNQRQSSTKASRAGKPLDLMAAIRAQKRTMSTDSTEDLPLF